MHKDEGALAPNLDQQLVELFKRCFSVADILSFYDRRYAVQGDAKVWEDFIQKHDCRIQAEQAAGKVFAEIKAMIDSGIRLLKPSLYLFFYAFHYGHFDIAKTLLDSISLKEDPDFKYQPVKLLVKIFNETHDDIKYSKSGAAVICAFIQKLFIEFPEHSSNDLMWSLPIHQIMKPGIGLSRKDCELLLRKFEPSSLVHDTLSILADNIRAMILIGVEIKSDVDKYGISKNMYGEIEHLETVKKIAYLLGCLSLKFTALPLEIRIRLFATVMPVLEKMDAEVKRDIIGTLKSAPAVTESNQAYYARQRRFVAIRGYTTFLERNGCPPDLQKTAVQFNRRLIESRLQFFQDEKTLPLNLTSPMRQQLVDKIGAEIDASPCQYHPVMFKQKIVDEGIKRVIEQQSHQEPAQAAAVKLPVKQQR